MLTKFKIWLKQFWCALEDHAGIKYHPARYGDEAWFECKRCGKQWSYDEFHE